MLLSQRVDTHNMGYVKETGISKITEDGCYGRYVIEIDGSLSEAFYVRTMQTDPRRLYFRLV